MYNCRSIGVDRLAGVVARLAKGTSRGRASPDHKSGEGFTMTDELRVLLNEISKLAPEQKSVYMTWAWVGLIRDLAYYALAALVAISLGRRLINAFLTAYRESKRA
jgi:hypothetical protein